MCNYLKSLIDVFASIWLIGDMILDGITTWEFYKTAAMATGDYSNFEESHPNPFDWDFLYPWRNQTINIEAGFFYASLGAILLPVPMGILIIAFYYSFKFLYYLNEKHCALTVFCGIFSLFPGILALILAVLVMPVVWVISPFIHFAQVMFALFGVKPVGGRETKVTGKQFTRFWLFVMFLKLIEQFFEAVPQVIITGLYTYRYQDKLDDHQFYFKNISLVFSIGSVFLFLALNIFKCTFDYENSLFGLIHHKDITKDKPPPYSEHDETMHFPMVAASGSQISTQISVAPSSSQMYEQKPEPNSQTVRQEQARNPSIVLPLVMALQAEKDEDHNDLC